MVSGRDGASTLGSTGGFLRTRGSSGVGGGGRKAGRATNATSVSAEAVGLVLVWESPGACLMTSFFGAPVMGSSAGSDDAMGGDVGVRSWTLVAMLVGTASGAALVTTRAGAELTEASVSAASRDGGACVPPRRGSEGVAAGAGARLRAGLAGGVSVKQKGD